VEIFDEDQADRLKELLPQCDCIRFSDGCWYKFTRKGATKEKAIMELCAACQITPENIIAFGDDFADIGMLKLCGLGIAMGNAIREVKEIADDVTNPMMKMVLRITGEAGFAKRILEIS